MHRTNEKITKTRRIFFFFLIWQETRKSRVLIIEGYRGWRRWEERVGPLFFGIFNYTGRNDCGRASRKNVTRNGTVM